MIPTAFTAAGQFYRGNLHTHSTLSDGVLDPSEVCRRYKAEGYDFISLTDHFIGTFGYPVADTRGFRDDAFTTILGAELHSGMMKNGELWHILAVGLPLDFAPSHSPSFSPEPGQETGPEIAQRARDVGAFVTVAHPQWSGLTLEDAMSVTAAHAVETYNHGCAIGCDRPDGFHTMELMLSAGRRVNLIATDDAHFSEPDHFGGWVMVKSQANEPDMLLAALKSGAYYSTQGPELHHVEVTDTEIIVECSAVASVIVQGHGAAARVQHGDSITTARIPLERFRKGEWLRVSVIDADAKRAWSNPIWL
ncbi:PHP domain-containing protein [Shimia litoralis]|uniref:PHP domain-containing protein n=1 Tax=Shimia litoralis TaxID=420403 RepID=A0A4U7N8W8_9RHOB|nr:CehA/McbA family metallohydrolase [Shimia litoralis]TKZ22147.1 PHP domain-containing protein [Shimia litoralis]